MKRIREEFPKLGEEVIRSEKLLSDTIMEDILDGSLNRAHFKNLQPHSEKLGINSWNSSASYY